MQQPVINLIVFALLLVAAAVLFWPRRGLIPRIRRHRAVEARVLVEDALKHIYHHEYKGHTASLASIGGALEIAAEEAMEIVGRMQVAGLATFTDGRILLTEEGKRYALQIIRAHRLWERFLADRTGVDPVRWHSEAERREHTMSPEDADELAAQLGDPRFDPHGDPIPTADGAVPHREVEHLETLDAGDRARIVHIEDEPAAVYAQLVAIGLFPGMELVVVARDDARIVCEADGRSMVLAPIVAHNVTVQTIEAPAPADAAVEQRTLADLHPGESAEVVRISPACMGVERRRLMDLGIVPGTQISFERRGLTGGLCAYRLRDTLVALREEQAGLIAVAEPAEVNA
jgi:DtxR family Mn-dependent transcriptional regulator